MARDNLALLFVNSATAAANTDLDAKIMVDTEVLAENDGYEDKPRINDHNNIVATTRSRALAAASAAALRTKAAAAISGTATKFEEGGVSKTTVPPPVVVESAIINKEASNDSGVIVEEVATPIIRSSDLRNNDVTTSSITNHVAPSSSSSAAALLNDIPILSSSTTPGAESLRYIKQFASPWLTSAVNLGERGRKTVIEKSMTLSPLLSSRERAANVTVVGSATAASSNGGSGSSSSADLLLNEERATVTTTTETATTTTTSISTTVATDDIIKSQEEYDKIDEEDCKRMKIEALMACQLASIRYDALVKFVSMCPYGSYEEFVEFLLMGGAMNAEDNGSDDDDDDDVAAAVASMQGVDDYYDEYSEYRQLWNDNLLLGLTIDGESSSTNLNQEGRAFVPSRVRKAKSTADSDNSSSNSGGYLGYFRDRTMSEGERIKNRIGQVDKQRIKQGLEYAEGALDRFESRLLRWRKEEDVDGGGGGGNDNNSDADNHRERTVSEEETIKNNNRIGQMDRQRIKQGLGSAVNVLSNVSSYALKPLRDMQLAEKLNALNLDMEEEEKRKEMEHYRRQWDTTLRPSSLEEEREMKEMLRMKQEAEDSCIRATTEHLLSFIKDHPDPIHATYQQWIADLHPENAHDGTLLEGLGKTIDHRFFVEESDHRRIWNDNLCTYLTEEEKEKDDQEHYRRDFVPARAKQQDQYGHAVTATDILSGSASSGGDVVNNNSNCKLLEEFPSQEDHSGVMNRKMKGDDNLDLIEFVDW